RRPPDHAARVIAAAWICLLAPAAGLALIAAAGMRITGRQAGLIASLSVLVSFAAAVTAFALLLGESPEKRSHSSTLWTWLSAGHLRFGMQILVDPLSVFMM